MSAAIRYRLTPDSWLGNIMERPAWNAAPGVGSRALEELTRPGGHFATAKVSTADTADVAELETIGFRVVDAALTLEAERVAESTSDHPIRFAIPGDRGAVEAIAGSAFLYSRFHLDPRVPREIANRIKAAWAGNWFAGVRGNGMIVCEEPRGNVAGFLLLLRAPESRLVIDLIAVRPEHGRKGLARAMIGFAARRGTGSEAPRGLVVGTQAANVPSLRLYESLGFRIRESKFVLHYHGGQS